MKRFYQVVFTIAFIISLYQAVMPMVLDDLSTEKKLEIAQGYLSTTECELQVKTTEEFDDRAKNADAYYTGDEIITVKPGKVSLEVIAHEYTHHKQNVEGRFESTVSDNYDEYYNNVLETEARATYKNLMWDNYKVIIF